MRPQKKRRSLLRQVDSCRRTGPVSGGRRPAGIRPRSPWTKLSNAAGKRLQPMPTPLGERKLNQRRDTHDHASLGGYWRGCYFAATSTSNSISGGHRLVAGANSSSPGCAPARRRCRQGSGSNYTSDAALWAVSASKSPGFGAPQAPSRPLKGWASRPVTALASWLRRSAKRWTRAGR